MTGTKRDFAEVVDRKYSALVPEARSAVAVVAALHPKPATTLSIATGMGTKGGSTHKRNSVRATLKSLVGPVLAVDKTAVEHRYALTPQAAAKLGLADVSAKSRGAGGTRAMEHPKPGAKPAKGPRTLLGVKIPEAHRDSAQSVVDEAVEAVKAGRPDNPYGRYHGRGAWKRQLFNAAVAVESAQPGAVAARQPAPAAIPVARSPGQATEPPGATGLRAAIAQAVDKAESRRNLAAVLPELVRASATVSYEELSLVFAGQGFVVSPEEIAAEVAKAPR